MPTLRLRNFRILKVEGEEGKKANVGTYYVRADVYDPKSGLDNYGSRNFFIPAMVNAVRQCFPTTGKYTDTDENGQAVERDYNGLRNDIPPATTRDEMEKTIPMLFKRIPNAESAVVDLGGEYARKRGRAGIDRDGNPYTEDDLILDGDGTFTVYETQTVLTSMKYKMIPATDANGNLIPNPKFDPNDENCTEEEWLQTVAKDEHGVIITMEAPGWESKPQADSIKRAFMLSAEAACAKCIKEGHPEQIPYRYRDKYPQAFAAGAAQATGAAEGAQPAAQPAAAPGGGTATPAF